MRKFFILLIFFFSYASFSMEQLKDLPKKPVETAQLARKYQKLCDTYNNNSTIIKLEESCSEFEDSIFYLIDKNTDSTSFLNISRKILKRIISMDSIIFINLLIFLGYLPPFLIISPS